MHLGAGSGKQKYFLHCVSSSTASQCACVDLGQQSGPFHLTQCCHLHLVLPGALAVDQVDLQFVHLLEEGGDLESVGLLALHCHLPPGPTSLNHTPARLSQESDSNKRMICVIII